MSDNVRSGMQSSFGYDFSQIRVQIDQEAAASARALDTAAYAFEKYAVFDRGLSCSLPPVHVSQPQQPLVLQRCGNSHACDQGCRSEWQHPSRGGNNSPQVPENGEERMLHLAGPASPLVPGVPLSVVVVLQSPGLPIDPATRASVESVFDHDLSQVRLHTDIVAVESADAVGALAYTVGQHIAFGRGRYAPASQEGRRLLVHELVHTVQASVQDGKVDGTLRIAPSDGPLEAEAARIAERSVLADEPPIRAGEQGRAPGAGLLHRQEARGRGTQEQVTQRGATARTQQASPLLYIVVRDRSLDAGGGTYADDLAVAKNILMRTTNAQPWTLVLSIHGSEERLGAQAPPNWQQNAVFYDGAAINGLFANDPAFVEWRNRFGPNHLVLNACQINIGFEQVIIRNLTRPGGTGGQTSQSAQGLGAGCRPITRTEQLKYTNPRLGFNDTTITTRAQWNRIPADDRAGLESDLQSMNREFGYFGAPPVPDTEVMRYYFDGPPHGGWVVVEIGVGDEHRPTGIPFWNRAIGARSGEFNRLCPRGIGELGGRAPSVPLAPREEPRRAPSSR